MRRLVLALVVVASAAACGGSSGASSASPGESPSASASAVGSSQLDPEVAMPAGFPSDVPVYPGARLTDGAKFSSSGPTIWGMEWETPDSIDKVHAFYTDKLSQGDWTVEFSGTKGASFSAVFTRKSNGKSTGILRADGSSGVTKVLLSLSNA